MSFICCRMLCVLSASDTQLPIEPSVFFLMIRRPPRSTLDRSSAASDVYKRQGDSVPETVPGAQDERRRSPAGSDRGGHDLQARIPVSYTHLRAHETVLDLVCRLLLEKKKLRQTNIIIRQYLQNIKQMLPTHVHIKPRQHTRDPHGS